MASEQPAKSKLIIDEDWKSQVQREKQEQQHKEAEATATQDVSSDAASVAASEMGDSDKPEVLPPPPPASMSLLIAMMATQAMSAMGIMPDEAGQTMPVNLDFARHFIDLLTVIEEKTSGNLSDAEKAYLQDALHQLRMAFVAVSKQAPVK